MITIHKFCYVMNRDTYIQTRNEHFAFLMVSCACPVLIVCGIRYFAKCWKSRTCIIVISMLSCSKVSAALCFFLGGFLFF